MGVSFDKTAGPWHDSGGQASGLILDVRKQFIRVSAAPPEFPRHPASDSPSGHDLTGRSGAVTHMKSTALSSTQSFTGNAQIAESFITG